MIIIQIALGVVLAVLILAFLPELMTLGAILVVAAIALIVGGFLLYWGVSDPIVFALEIVAAVCIAIFLYWKKDAPIRNLKDRIRRRQSAGYDTVDLERELSEAMRVKQARAGRLSKPKSRRELGYTDDQ